MILGGRFFQVSNTMFCYGLTPIQFAVYCYLELPTLKLKEKQVTYSEASNN